MNTTQFDWVKNRMPDNTQPVPPIFEPEISAEVVVAAGLAKRPRREYWVGSPTVAAIIGQKFIPGLLDIYLGKTGYRSQQIQNEPRDPKARRTISTNMFLVSTAHAASSITVPNAPARKSMYHCIASGSPWVL